MAIGDKSYTLEINDSEFEREGWKRARYQGSKLTATKINKFTEGDISFARQPVIEQYSKTVYVFNQSNESFEARAGVFYPTTDEFDLPLTDRRIVGSTQFKIDRAVTFTLDEPNNFSQIEPGVSSDEISYNYFNHLIKNDLALFNSCSVRFFDNFNNGFTKPIYTVMYNKAEFKPASVYFTSKSIGSESVDTQVKVYHTGDRFDYELSDGGRLYINPNVEVWFTTISGSSGSQGTINTTNNEAITLKHHGVTGSVPGPEVNGTAGYFFELSKRINNSNEYYIVFADGIKGSGSLIQKDLLKAFDIHRIESSGSNVQVLGDLNTVNNIMRIKTTGRHHGFFADHQETGDIDDFAIFKATKTNNVIHLDMNFSVEAPNGTGDGGVIIPSNLHPKIKESLNVYLSNAGLGAEGGSLANFAINEVSAVQRAQALPETPTLPPPPPPDNIEPLAGTELEPLFFGTKVTGESLGNVSPIDNIDGYGGPSPGNPHTPSEPDEETGIVGGAN